MLQRGRRPRVRTTRAARDGHGGRPEEGRARHTGKPFTGAFGPGRPDFKGNAAAKDSRAQAPSRAPLTCSRPRPAGRADLLRRELGLRARRSRRKSRSSKTKAQILWVIARGVPLGSHAPAYGTRRLCGGGLIIGKGTHPLTTVLYLKRIEGLARTGKPIRPAR